MVHTSGVYLIILWISFSEGAVFISPNETTWNDTTTICKVALPEINYEASTNGEEFIVDYTGNFEDEDLKDGVWVGYYISATPFQYIGCTNIGKITATAHFDKDIPGLCFSACKTKGVIGISNKKCYCLNNISGLDTSAINCTNGCEDQPNMACGGEHHMSLYTIGLTDFKTKKVSNKKKKCLRYEINNNVSLLIWKKCDDTVQIICTLNNGSVEVLSRQYTPPRTWKDAMNFCLENSKHPTTVKHLDQLKRRETLPPSWTGAISSVVIYSKNDPATRQTGETFGYLKKSGQKIVLKFDNHASSSRKILCTSGRTKIESDDDTNTFRIFSSNVGVAVGISVVLVLVIVALVVAVFILKRRGKLEGIRFKMPTNNKPVQRTQHLSIVHNNTYETPSDSPYNEIDDASLQKNSDAKDNTFGNDGHYAHTYFVLEGLESDPKADNGISNSRHEESNSEFNTISSNIKRGNKTNNAYDTTENAVKRLKDQHDNGIDDMKGNNSDTMKEDDYNHISDAALKNKRTDNDYGLPSSGAENEYGDVRKNNGNALHGDRDQYNHIQF